MKNLTEKAILVSVQISQWTARKYDRKITDEVNKNHNSKDAGRFNKIAKEHLQAISQIANKARTFHYDNTLPWSDNGERLLPSENYFQYIGRLSELKNEFESTVSKFMLEYPAMIEEAKINLNGLFNQSDYPSNIGDRFAIKSSFMPVPEVEDIRIDLAPKELDSIKAQVQRELSERFSAAQKDIYQRVIEQLRHMHERLSNKDNAFKNSLFENVLELVDLLPRLNVINDENITAMCAELKGLYCDPENVRKSNALRKEKAKEVDAMLAKIDSFLKP